MPCKASHQLPIPGEGWQSADGQGWSGEMCTCDHRGFWVGRAGRSASNKAERWACTCHRRPWVEGGVGHEGWSLGLPSPSSCSSMESAHTGSG